MAVQLIHEDDGRLHLRPPLEPEPSSDVDIQVKTLAVISGLANILAARLILLFAVLASAGLTTMAVYYGKLAPIFGAATFDIFVVIHLIGLALRKG